MVLFPGISGAVEIVVMALVVIVGGAVALVIRKAYASSTDRKTLLNIVAGVACIGVIAVGALGLSPTANTWLGIPTSNVGPQVNGGGEVVQADKIGYVIATTIDAYQLPASVVSSAQIYVSLNEPVINSAWQALVQDNTGTSGGVMASVPGVTSGTVFVTGGKSGYYPDIQSTVIKGAQVVDASTAVALSLADIGTYAWGLKDNTNGWKVSTNYIYENTTTSTSAVFTIQIWTSEAYSALRNMRLLLVRGDSWDTLGASCSPVVTSDGGCTVTSDGDVTMSTEISGSYIFSGDLKFGQTIDIKVITDVTTAGDGTIVKLYFDDLNGTYDVLGGTGIAENVISIYSQS